MTALNNRNSISRRIRMSGSTPTGRGRPYSYYVAMMPEGLPKIHIPTERVDSQVPELLAGIFVSPERLPLIRKAYREDIAQLKQPGFKERLATLQGHLERLKDQERAYARLYAAGNLSDEGYSILRQEWKTAIFQVEQEMSQLQGNTDDIKDDLEQALLLLAALPELYDRMEETCQRKLLQILFKQIIIDAEGVITRVEMNPPFAYLSALAIDQDDRQCQYKPQAVLDWLQSPLLSSRHRNTKKAYLHKKCAGTNLVEWVRTIREECLDKLLIINEPHLRRVIKDYEAHYNHHRPHQGIYQQSPTPFPTPETQGNVYLEMYWVGSSMSIIGRLHEFHFEYGWGFLALWVNSFFLC